MKTVQVLTISCLVLFPWINAAPFRLQNPREFKVSSSDYGLDLIAEVLCLLGSSSPLILKKQGSPGRHLRDTRGQQSSHVNCSQIQQGRETVSNRTNNSPPINSSCSSDWMAPWHVGLMLLTSDIQAKRCGGVLVHRQWVVTAAHCLDNTIDNPHVMVGSKKYLDGFFVEGQVLSVKKSIVHEKYKPATIYQPPLHDIALLRLSHKVQLGTDVKLASIPDQNSSLLYNDTKLMISGWRITNTSNTVQDELRCAQVPTVSLQDCQCLHQKLGFSGIRSSHVCAGYPSGGVGPCNGDSGGGLVHHGPDGKNSVLGIISWSHGCGIFPAVYTNVQRHRAWLLRNAPELGMKH